MSTIRIPRCSSATTSTQQNPLVAWQIRTAIRHRKARLYVINGRPSKIHRKASYLVEMPKGAKRQAVRWLATGDGQFDENTRAALAALKAGLEKESDVVIIFGADIQGAALRDLVNFGSKLSGHTRFMALGDYANSRGAADMGILPDRLPGYAPLSDAPERARFGKLWGGEIPSAPGLTARAMMDAAAGGKIKALYVVGANPVKTFNVKQPDRLAALELLVVQDMFLTETAAARRCGAPRRFHLRKRRHADQHRRGGADDASLDRSARTAQRLRPDSHPFASAEHARC